MDSKRVCRVTVFQKLHSEENTFEEEKMRFGFEKTTVIDVCNELKKRYSKGKIRRPFFNSFYLTNPLISSLLKRFLQIC